MTKKDHIMPINMDKPHLWKADAERSIDFYNDWFLRFAPDTFRTQRRETARQVKVALKKTDLLKDISPEILRENPGILPILRMVCAPPIARDRLVGLAHLSKNLVTSMEGHQGKPPRIPPRMKKTEMLEQLQRITDTVMELTDRDLFPWIETGTDPTPKSADRAAMIVADRLCGVASDPIIRNAQEKRQLSALSAWLMAKGYEEISPNRVKTVCDLSPGHFAFRMNVPVQDGVNSVNIPVDCVVQPFSAKKGGVPILVEAKSAGDETNTNKRRKEEAQKFSQLKKQFGESVSYILFLCGYFGPGYLGYEAAEGIDWVWEHRLSDLDFLFDSVKTTGFKVELRDSHTPYKTVGKNEELRLEAQLTIDDSRKQIDRNRMGQFSTPFRLACEMLLDAKSMIEPGNSISFLEPALGSGVFFSALDALEEKSAIKLATGVEVDAEYAAVASKFWGAPPFEVRVCDFLDFAISEKNSESYNLLTTNPPYVRHHHLASSTKLNLQRHIRKTLDLSPSGLSGLYVYFILLSHQVLGDNAVASWLIPSEFLAVNYGKVLRQYLLTKVSLVRIHQFSPVDVQFDDALVSSCIVTYVKRIPEKSHRFEFSSGGSLHRPEQRQSASISQLSPEQKWSFCKKAAGTVNAYKKNGVRIGDLFGVKRGIATGANDFFIIDQKTIRRYDIPEQFLRPILPSPRYVNKQVITAKPNGLPDIENAKFLLDCRLPPEQIKTDYKGLWEYLQKGEDDGVATAYICAHRKYWYLQEYRPPPMFFATYMSRSRSGEKNPFRFFLNFSNAIATNVFLFLYPKPALLAAIDSKTERMREMLDLFSSLSREYIVEGGRTYGGGLHKLEPRELANLYFPHKPEWMNVRKQLEFPSWESVVNV
ncbi:MAG: XamI family restriction endonuclease [Lentisphaeria bacterium]|nr:XamI family restriction endonuclease [Lentisphaeria bacterium]